MGIMTEIIGDFSGVILVHMRHDAVLASIIGRGHFVLFLSMSDVINSSVGSLWSSFRCSFAECLKQIGALSRSRWV